MPFCEKPFVLCRLLCALFTSTRKKTCGHDQWPSHFPEINPFGGWRDVLLLFGPKRPTDYSKFLAWSNGTLLLHARFVLFFSNCPSKKEYILHTTSIISGRSCDKFGFLHPFGSRQNSKIILWKKKKLKIPPCGVCFSVQCGPEWFFHVTQFFAIVWICFFQEKNWKNARVSRT